MKLTRRELAGTLTGTVAAALVSVPEIVAQAPPAPADYLAAARESHRENSDVLRKFDLPVATEPAFAFKA